MTKTNRIFKDSYSIRPSTIFKKGWSLSTRKIKDGVHSIEIIVDTESEPMAILNEEGGFTLFSSHEVAQSFVDDNTPFIISAEFRNNLLATAYGNKVLEYSLEDGKILATWNQEKFEKCFFVVDEYLHYKKYAKVDELEGKTVNEVMDIIAEWTEQAYDDSIQGHADSYFNLINRTNDDCSTCGGGGCVHCSPSDFI